MPQKRGKRKQHGGGFGDVVSKLNKIAKDTKVITTALNTLAPDSGIAQTVSEMAGQLGYGRRKRKQRGGNFAETFGNILGGIGGGLGRGVNQTLGGLFGGGRQRGGMRVQSYAVNPMMIR